MLHTTIGYNSWLRDFINEWTSTSPKLANSCMKINNTWLWSFLGCQSIHNHHLINYLLFWTNIFKENINCKTNLPISQEVARIRLTLAWLCSNAPRGSHLPVDRIKLGYFHPSNLQFVLSGWVHYDALLALIVDAMGSVSQGVRGVWVPLHKPNMCAQFRTSIITKSIIHQFMFKHMLPEAIFICETFWYILSLPRPAVGN